MRDHRPTLTNELLESQQLIKIQKHAKQINVLNSLLRTLIPKNLIEQCRVANIKDNHLIVEVANASIQMKLNYERLNLLSQFRKQGASHLISIQIQINPSLYIGSDPTVTNTNWQKVPVSEVAAEFLLATANMPNTSLKIKKRLESIAKLANKK